MESSGYKLCWAPPGEKCGLVSGVRPGVVCPRRSDSPEDRKVLLDDRKSIGVLS